MNLEVKTVRHMKHPCKQETMDTTNSRIRFLRTSVSRSDNKIYIKSYWT